METNPAQQARYRIDYVEHETTTDVDWVHHRYLPTAVSAGPTSISLVRFEAVY
jgi:hypothetical protein